IEVVSERLNGPWWDSHDVERIGEEIVYTLAEQFGAPGHDKYGSADFPGVDGVEVVEWDVGRSQSLIVKGVLTRDNAPRLPWSGKIYSVVLGSRDYGENVYVETDYDDDVSGTGAETDAMREAVEDALQTAWSAGYQENQYMESAEYALGWIEANQPYFTGDGSLF
nr:hypothetical protein [Micromonospora sp. DSM 115978]